MIAVNLSSTSGSDIKCIFHPQSHAIGCFINLTNVANGITYCIALQRFLNSSENNLHIFQSCSPWFESGNYLLQAYDIANDGNVSKHPAITEEVILETFEKMVPQPSFSSMTSSRLRIVNIY